MMETRRAFSLATRAIASLALAMLVFDPGLRAQETVATLEARAQAADNAGQRKEAFELYLKAFQSLADPPPSEADIRIRSRLLALAAGIRPEPVIPEDTHRFTVRGQTLVKDAKNQAGFAKAATEFQKAVRAAPWLPATAFNLAVAEEKAGHYKAAITNLRLYVETNPADAAEIRTKLYELEARHENDPIGLEEEACADGDLKACSKLSHWDAKSYDPNRDKRSDPARAIELFRKACAGLPGVCEAELKQTIAYINERMSPIKGCGGSMTPLVVDIVSGLITTYGCRDNVLLREVALAGDLDSDVRRSGSQVYAACKQQGTCAMQHNFIRKTWTAISDSRFLDFHNPAAGETTVAAVKQLVRLLQVLRKCPSGDSFCRN